MGRLLLWNRRAMLLSARMPEFARHVEAILKFTIFTTYARLGMMYHSRNNSDSSDAKKLLEIANRKYVNLAANS